MIRREINVFAIKLLIIIGFETTKKPINFPNTTECDIIDINERQSVKCYWIYFAFSIL